MGERGVRNAEVEGSNPLPSTIILLRRAPPTADSRGEKRAVMRAYPWMLMLALALPGLACARLEPPSLPVVAGRWSGSWSGYGILEIPREGAASAELGPDGQGRLILEGVSAAEDVPIAFRVAGTAGARVLVELAPGTVVMRHELGPDRFEARFTVQGDRMVGRLEAIDPPIVIELVREESAGPPVAPPLSR